MNKLTQFYFCIGFVATSYIRFVVICMYVVAIAAVFKYYILLVMHITLLLHFVCIPILLL